MLAVLCTYLYSVNFNKNTFVYKYYHKILKEIFNKDDFALIQ